MNLPDFFSNTLWVAQMNEVGRKYIPGKLMEASSAVGVGLTTQDLPYAQMVDLSEIESGTEDQAVGDLIKNQDGTLMLNVPVPTIIRGALDYLSRINIEPTNSWEEQRLASYVTIQALVRTSLLSVPDIDEVTREYIHREFIEENF